MKMPSASASIKYSGSRRVPMKLSRVVTRTEINKPKMEMGLINGRTPESSYEWNIALALWKYGWKFYYQLSVLGGADVRGGQRLDFLVFTRPFYTALDVYGEYWHRNAMREQVKNTQLISGLRAMGYLVNNEVLTTKNTDAATPEDAASFIYSKLGRG